MTTQHIKNFLPSIRWEILRTAYAGGTLGVTEMMVVNSLRNLYPFFDQPIGREQLTYLRKRGLIELECREDVPWRATLTANGTDMFEYRIKTGVGISRPVVPQWTP